MSPALAAAPLLDATRKVNRLTLFVPGAEPEEIAGFEALAARLAAMAAGRPLTYRIGHAAYPGFDTFPSLTAYAGAELIGMIADRWHDEADVEAARRILHTMGAPT